MLDTSTNGTIRQWADPLESSGLIIQDPLYVVVPMICVYALILISGVVGNIITCIVIINNKHMHTATNYYLCSLAVSDLLLLVTGLPVEMYHTWRR